MGNLRGKLLSFFLLLFISMPFYVSALPDGADTCNVEDMAKIGHGASGLKGSAGFLMATKMQAPGKFEFTISGGDGIEGLLVYVLDANNKRLGQFTTLPANTKIKTNCDAQTTVTHSNKSVKKLPFTLNWEAPTTASGSLTIKSLVVKDYANWARLDDVSFDVATGVSSTVSSGASDDTTGSTGSDGFLQKYTLFIIMISITTLLYIVGSVTEAMLKRQQVKSRSFAKTIQNGFGDSR